MCKKWLRQYILEHKSWCISFHLPSGSIRESAHSSFHQLLWNHKNFNLCVVAFKFAISFRVSPRLVAMFLLPQNKLQRRFQVTGGSPFVQQSNSSFSQSRAIFPKDRAAVHSLVKVTRAPPPLGFRIPCFCQFAVAIAPGTCRADSHRDAYSSSLLTMKKAMFSKNHVLKDFVIHCQDHQPGHFMMFCPCLYYESSVRTWNAPDIFEQLTTGRFDRVSQTNNAAGNSSRGAERVPVGT